LTDGESQTYSPVHVAQSLQSARTGLIVVRFWRASERVFVHGLSAGYLPTSSSIGPLADLGRLSAGSRVFGEHDASAAAGAARALSGSGPTRAPGARRRSVPLAPWLTLAALVPLGLVLGRRGGGMTARRTATFVLTQHKHGVGAPERREQRVPAAL